MAKGKKNTSVQKLVDFANMQLARNPTSKVTGTCDVTIEFKIGIVAMIETALRNADRYEGFYFLDNEDCEVDTFGYYSRKYYYHGV